MEEPGEHDTVFIVGTGAERGAWRPVIAAINEALRASAWPMLRDDEQTLALTAGPALS